MCKHSQYVYIIVAKTRFQINFNVCGLCQFKFFMQYYAKLIFQFDTSVKFVSLRCYLLLNKKNCLMLHKYFISVSWHVLTLLLQFMQFLSHDYGL